MYVMAAIEIKGSGKLKVGFTGREFKLHSLLPFSKKKKMFNHTCKNSTLSFQILIYR